ncbi:MAG: YdjY domain-containing protein [Phycisphaeraceae bacterium]
MRGRISTIPVALLACALGAAASVAAERPAVEMPALDSLEKSLPGISIHLEKRQLDLEATVIRQEGDWLELLACTPNSREHESILTVKARPSHIHLALLLLDYQPGSPMRWEQTDDGYIAHPPRGDKLSAFIVYENENGEPTEIPATDWIQHQPTGEAMAGNIWLFTGSTFQRYQEQEIYTADVNGTVLSLVNFGDDLIGRPTDVTDQSDAQRWNSFAERIPEPGTKVTLRLRAYEGDADDAREQIDAQQEAVDEPPAPPDAGHEAPPSDDAE